MLIDEEIIHSDSWTLSRGKMPQSNDSFLVKKVTKKYQEYYLTNFEKEIKSNRWMLQPLEQFDYMYEQVTVFENFRGIPLKTFIERPISLAKFFQIAEELVNSCILVHQQGILLNRLNPMTILIHPKTLQLKIIPTNGLSRWGIKSDIENNIYEMMFMAPEQMSMLHSEIDERVDLYALGAIFYTMLAGSLYDATSKEQLMFQLMTTSHNTSIIEKNYGQPELQAVINKLLAKNPNDRYQTAYALKKDLQLLQQQKLTNLASADQMLKPNIPSKLIGRDSMVTQLESMYHHCIEGKKQFVLIEGSSGVGKTSLAYSLQEQVLEKQGYFIECKFEEIQEHQTWIFIEPFRQLIKQLYFKGNAGIQQFKQQAAVVELILTPHLVQLIPELQLLLEDSDVLRDDNDQGVQQHTYVLTTLQKILSIFVSLKQPIVLCIEDCQWAQPSILQYFEQLYTNHHNGYLFIVATKRTSNNGASAYLFQNLQPKRLLLEHLNEKDVVEWLQYAIQLRKDIAQPFAKQFYQFTNGNPFFMKKLFIEMLSSRALYFDLQHEMWRVNSLIFEEIFSDNTLTQFIANRTNILSMELQNILQMAACIGQSFHAKTIVQIANCSMEQWQTYAKVLIEGGYIITKRLEGREVFQFIHGSIQETIYNKMDAKQRQSLHYKIGKYYLENRQDVSIQQIVNQLNLCINFLNEKEKLKLVQWNNELGKKSANAGLYLEALEMYKCSKNILPENHWIMMHEESMEIFKAIGESAFLMGERQFAEEHLAIALKNAVSKIEKLEIYLLMIFLYMEAEDNERALQTMNLGYKLCQIDLPLNPSMKEVYFEYVKLQLFLRKRKNMNLTEITPIQNKEIELLLKMNSALLSGTFRLEGNMTAVYFFRAIQLTLKYGVIKESSIIYMNYALASSIMFSNLEHGERFAKAAIHIGKNMQDGRVKSTVYFLYSVYHYFFGNKFEESLRYLKEGQTYANQFTVQSIYGSSSIILFSNHWHKSMHLKALKELICLEQQKQELYQANTAIDFLNEMNEWVECLRDREIKPIWNKVFTHNTHHAIVVLHHIYRMQMSYLYGDKLEAENIMRTMEVPLKQKINIVTTPYYIFYESLWIYDFIRENPLRTQKKLYSKKIKKTTKRLKALAKILPHLYEHLYLLICAENHALKGEEAEAMLLYDHALQVAQIRRYFSELAVIYERASKFYQRMGNQDKAAKYMRLGIENLNNWGAYSIADIWTQRVEYYDTAFEVNEDANTTHDLLAVLETSQSLAKEIKMEQLLEQLLFVLLKQANATSCYFLTIEDKQLYLKASLQSENMDFQYTEGKTALPNDIQAIAHFVLQCKEPVLLKNVQQSSLFRQIRTNVKSMLCAPIYFKGEIIAVVYLESNVLYNAFNESQMKMIELIAMQVAVSIENAKVYAELEQRVALRTQQLEESNQHLMLVNAELGKNEKQRQRLYQSVSHELRSPLTSTLGYIEAILDGLVAAPKQQDYLLRSKERLLTMKRLIDDLFDLAKLEAGRNQLELETINIVDFINKCIKMYEVEVKNKNLQYESMCLVAKSRFMLVDEARLHQVINNVMVNSMKYTSNGVISFIAYEEEERLMIEIKDTGIGIAEQDLPFIFDNFYKSTQTKGYDANGLGLAICKQIIEQHDGKITAESELNKGSTFKIELPIVR